MFNDPFMTMAVLNANDGNPHNDHLATTLAMTSMMNNPNSNPTTNLLMMNAMSNPSNDNNQLARNMMMVNSLNQMEQQRIEEERRERELERQRRAVEAERQRQIEAERQRQEAERRRQEAITRQNTFNDLMDRGMGFASTKQYSSALEQFNLALDLFPGNFEASANKAICLKNLERYKEAYDLLLSISGQANKMPGFEQHMEFCENKLIKICNQLFADATNFYNSGEKENAKQELKKITTLAPTRVPAGEELVIRSNVSIRQLGWDDMRGKVVVNINEGYDFLKQKNFNLALNRFENCRKTFKEYEGVALSEQEQTILTDLPGLIKQANRGIEWRRNIQLQAEINTALGNLRDNVKDFKIVDAIEICSNMKKTCEAISQPSDIDPQQYISPERMQEALLKLARYNEACSQRNKRYVATVKESLKQRFKEATMLLNESDMSTLKLGLEMAINQNWQDLDSRELDNITQLLVDTVISHCKAHNVFGACCAGVSHYADNDDAKELRKFFDDVIKANIPADIRQPIQLESLRPMATSVQVGFSGYMTGAGAPQQEEIVRAVEVMPEFDLNKDAQEQEPSDLPQAQYVAPGIKF